MNLGYVAFCRNNPLSTPNWRFLRIKGLTVESQQQRSSYKDDLWTGKGRKFVKELSECRTETDHSELFAKNPDAYHAYELYAATGKDADKVRLIVESRLLTGMSFSEIASKNRMSEEALRWYEALFFDVADHLDKTDWIHTAVLVPAERQAYVNSKYRSGQENAFEAIANPILDASLKYFSYYGGQHFCETIIRGFRDDLKVENPRQALRALRKIFIDKLTIRAVTAVHRMQTSNFNANELLNTYARFQEQSIAAAKAAKTGNDGVNTPSRVAEQLHAALEFVPFAVLSRDEPTSFREQRDAELLGEDVGDAFESFPGFGKAVAKETA